MNGVFLDAIQVGQFEHWLLWIGVGFSFFFMLIVLAFYLDSLNFIYYKKVTFEFEDLSFTYWYKWKWFTSKGSPYFIWRKIKISNNLTDQSSEHIMDPVSEHGHVLYFYLDHNYKTHSGMLFDALVIRDAEISMGFDYYSTDYLGKQYVYERREEQTEYIGMIEAGKFYKSEGQFRNVESREMNY